MARGLGGGRRAVAMRSGAIRWVPVVMVVLLWEGMTRVRLVDPMLLPPFSQVITRGWGLLRSGRLLADLAASMWRVFLGFGLAALLACPAGMALGLYPPLERASSLLLSALRPLSPPAWIPLAILWFGIGDPPALFIIFVGTFFSLLLGITAATRAIEPQLVQAALTLGASRWQAVRHVILPSLVPALMTQARIGLGLAWMCVIAAEMVAVRRGLGFFMIEARHLFRTEDVIVGMMAVAAVGLMTDRALRILERRICRWRVRLTFAQPDVPLGGGPSL